MLCNPFTLDYIYNRVSCTYTKAILIIGRKYVKTESRKNDFCYKWQVMEQEITCKLMNDYVAKIMI